MKTLHYWYTWWYTQIMFLFLTICSQSHVYPLRTHVSLYILDVNLLIFKCTLSVKSEHVSMY